MINLEQELEECIIFKQKIKNKISCCDYQLLIESIDGYIVCNNCGKVQKIKYEKEINFNHPIVYRKNNYMIKKLKKVLINFNVNSSEIIINDIISLFEKINQIAINNKLVNKYSLNYNFTIFKIFELLNLDTSLIKVTNNPILIEKYNKIWEEILKDLN